MEIRLLILAHLLIYMSIITTDYSDKIFKGLIDELVANHSEKVKNWNEFDYALLSLILTALPLINLLLCYRYRNVNVYDE